MTRTQISTKIEKGISGISAPKGFRQIIISHVPPPPRVQRTITSSKNTVRTGVFVAHTIWYLNNSVPEPGTTLIGSQKNTVRTEEFVGQVDKAFVGHEGAGGLLEVTWTQVLAKKKRDFWSHHVEGVQKSSFAMYWVKKKTDHFEYSKKK